MSEFLAELDCCLKPIGALNLRRDSRLGAVREFRITSPFTTSDVRLGADACVGETLDGNHAPDQPLDNYNAGFHRVGRLRVRKPRLKPGGVFGLWSDKITDHRFLDRLGMAFARAEAG